jgi:2',3'-cyclic-nucleotide 2'-phosphodiesterase (5'-nucleotidase family)
VARRATLIQQARVEDDHILLLDAGDSLYGDISPAQKTNGASSVQVMNKLAYDAMALGARDAAMGFEIEKRIAEAEFAILSANAYRKSNHELLARPYVLKQIAGQKVAIIGVSEPFTHSDYYATDPIPAVETVVKELGTRARVIILLSHAGPETDAQIARQIPEIDVIISGGTTSTASPHQDLSSGTVLVHAEAPSTGHAGMYMGRGTFSFDKKGALTHFEWTRVTITEDTVQDPDIAQWMIENP